MQVTFFFNQKTQQFASEKNKLRSLQAKDKENILRGFFSCLRKIKPSLLSSNILYLSGYKGGKGGTYSLSTITTALLTPGSSGLLKFQPCQIHRAAVLLNTEYDTRIVPANGTSITVRVTLTFLVILIGSYFQGLEFL